MRVLTLALAIVVSGNVTYSTLAADRPNIVFMIADDLGWTDVAFHGGTAPTPNLDKLAQAGLELQQHYVAPVCSPTRTGLMTGRCWSRFGITNPSNTRCLPWDTLTLPRALQQSGYATCITGKWHLGSVPQHGPNHFGFDHAYGSLAGGVSPWSHGYKQGPFSKTWHRNGELIEEQGHVTDLIVNEAIQWIEKQRDQPFFLYVPFTAVHLPIKEPEAWLARVPDSIIGDVPRHYAACVMHLDDAVGKIVQTIHQAGKSDQTLVVFTSDNGGSTAENNDPKYPDDQCPNGKLVGNNKPFRGEKASVYEGGTRVPTIAYWPSKISARKNSTPVQITDWMPTLCSLIGYTPSKQTRWDGIDISAMLLKDQTLSERSIYTVGPNWKARALRFGDWKLVSTEDPKGTKYELFNVANDPSETKNLAETESKQLVMMRDRMDRAAQADRDSVAKD